MPDLTPVEWIDPDQIKVAVQRKTPQGFADLCNTVLDEIGLKIGAEPGCLQTTLDVFSNDDGLDAACVEAGQSTPHWIPDPDLVGYQFKSGTNAKSARVLVRDDIRAKDGVMELLEEGGAFVYMSAWEQANFQSEIREQAREQDIEEFASQLYYVNGDMIARQIQRLPGLLAGLEGIPFGDVFTFQEWQRVERLNNPFQSDDDVKARLSYLRNRLEEPSARLRVVGRPGDGKTRTVRKAIRGSGREASTVYARRPECIPNGLLQYLRQKEQVKCTLIVDEVDPDTAENCESALEPALSENISLILIGAGSLDQSAPVYSEVLEVEPLSETLIETIVKSGGSGVPSELAEDIARISSGSPGMALLLARHVTPEVPTRQRLLADQNVQSAINSALGIDFTDIRWRAAAVIALFNHVGWENQISDEADQTFRAAQLDVEEARSAVAQMHDQFGILPIGAGVRYVSPDALAHHLATKRISDWSRGQFRTFLEELTPRLIEGFASRVREVGSALGSDQRLVEDLILGEKGPFRSLDDLEDGQAATVIRLLAGPYRRATLRLLRRVIGPASKAELEEATGSRRDMVRALQELLWFRDSFEEAASLLLRLAAAENEGWGNNASGIWEETFQTFLGRTKAGRVKRLRVLRAAAESDDSDERRLAARALRAGLQAGHVTRMGTPPDDIEDAPKDVWQPENGDQWGEIVLSYLHILEPLLEDPAQEVASEAVAALEEGTRVALLFPQVADRWRDLAGELRGAEYDERAALATTIGQEVRRARKEIGDARDELTEERLEELEERLERFETLQGELEGDDFESRFRKALTAGYFETEGGFEEAKRRIQEALETLVQEVLEEPRLLAEQWSWMVEERPVHAGEFFHTLGSQDCGRELAARLQDVALDQEQTWSWLSIYDLGHWEDCVDGDAYVRDRVEELRESGAPARQRLDFLVRVGYSPDRYELLLDLFTTGELSNDSIARLKYSAWTEELSEGEVRRLLEQIDREPATTPHLVTFLYGFIRGRPDVTEELRQIILDVLGSPASQDEHPTQHYEWSELAKACLTEAPIEVAAAAADRIGQLQASHEQRLTSVIRSAWENGPREELFREVIAPRLDSESNESWWVRQALSPLELEALDTDRLCEWIADAPSRRVHAVAELIGPPGGEEPSDLHGELLERFNGYDVGDDFYIALQTGTWTGSRAKRTRGLIDRVESWIDDDRAAVREWAEETLERLEHSLEQDEKRELQRKIQGGNRPPRPEG